MHSRTFRGRFVAFCWGFCTSFCFDEKTLSRRRLFKKPKLLKIRVLVLLLLWGTPDLPFLFVWNPCILKFPRNSLFFCGGAICPHFPKSFGVCFGRNPRFFVSFLASYKQKTRKRRFGRGEKTPTPKIAALLRKRPVLLRANFVLTKDRKRPYYRYFCGKVHREGSCSIAAGRP